jgi:hypothetical protein
VQNLNITRSEGWFWFGWVLVNVLAVFVAGLVSIIFSRILLLLGLGGLGWGFRDLVLFLAKSTGSPVPEDAREAMALYLAIVSAPVLPLFGAVVGAIQWRYLRPHLHNGAGWWVGATTVGYVLSWPLSLIGIRAMNSAAFGAIVGGPQ